jgi:thiol-disulfide isomerase/thioredoxin
MSVAASLALWPIAADAATLETWTEGPPPSLRLKTLEGKELTLASFRGRTVIVNFWATWCGPCLAEMPSLQRLRDRLAPEGVEVIAVNLKESTVQIAPFVERLGITFPVVRDVTGTVSSAWHVNVFPTTFVIGPDQRIAMVVRGEVDWDSGEVEAQIRRVNQRGRMPGVQRTSGPQARPLSPPLFSAMR